jgi:hypothetical protein
MLVGVGIKVLVTSGTTVGGAALVAVGAGAEAVCVTPGKVVFVDVGAGGAVC